MQPSRRPTLLASPFERHRRNDDADAEAKALCALRTRLARNAADAETRRQEAVAAARAQALADDEEREQRNAEFHRQEEIAAARARAQQKLQDDASERKAKQQERSSAWCAEIRRRAELMRAARQPPAAEVSHVVSPRPTSAEGSHARVASEPTHAR